MRFITLIGLLLCVAAGPSTAPAKPDAKTQAAFERLKSTAGQWRGKSTKGWTEILDTQLIADGTCVMESSKFAHGEGTSMATMYHLDGDRLMLIHYCMAHNQPRLIARQISDDGKDITFEFLDGTNIPTRDVGHMDKVTFHFIDNDHYKSQWSFYAKGKEQFMEEIEYERVAGPTTEPSK